MKPYFPFGLREFKEKSRIACIQYVKQQMKYAATMVVCREASVVARACAAWPRARTRVAKPRDEKPSLDTSLPYFFPPNRFALYRSRAWLNVWAFWQATTIDLKMFITFWFCSFLFRVKASLSLFMIRFISVQRCFNWIAR